MVIGHCASRYFASMGATNKAEVPGAAHSQLVVVTGASRGVGAATVHALVRAHGAQVLAVARDGERMAAALAGLPCELVVADVGTAQGRAQIADAVGERAVRALVNNAGVLVRRDFGSWTTDDLELVARVNAHAPLLLVQDLLPALIAAAPAHVVNIGSMGGFQGAAKFPGLLGYSASKAALACITECLAEELQAVDVRCNCLCLGAVDTEMVREAFPGYQAPVTADEMGAYVARFACEGHKVLNGKVIPLALSTP